MFSQTLNIGKKWQLKSIAFSFAVSFAALLVPSLPAYPEEGRKLYEYDFVVTYNSPDSPVPGVPSLNLPLKASPGYAFTELRNCFNCSFPIQGAPRAYPVAGQFIPLIACAVGPFGCRDAPVKAYPYDSSRRLVLVAQPGHFDGADSRVTFRFYTDSQGVLHLKVIGFVTNPEVPDSLNKTFAQSAWGNFARQLGISMWINTCARGRVCGD